VSDRLESIVPIGSRVFVVLPDDDGRNFVCPVVYTGYTLDVTLDEKRYTHWASELDFEGNYDPDEEEVVDPGLIRWTEFEALEAFKLAYPGEPVFGVLHQPTLEEAALAGK
jgi:hypothetical protein